MLALLALLAINLIVFNFSVSKISHGPSVDHENSRDTAMLVIDIQESTTGSVSINDSFISQADTLITRVNRLTGQASKRGWTIVYINMEVVNPLVNLLNNSMAKGSEGVELDRRLELYSDHIITKRKQDAFNGTGLDKLLQKSKIGTLYLTGLDATGCVNSTVQAALNRDYWLKIVPEVVISDSDTARLNVLEEFQRAGVELISLNSIWER